MAWGQMAWGLILSTLAMLMSSPALAQSDRVVSKAEDKQLGFIEAASPVMEEIAEFHDLLLIIITIITIFVFLLLFWVMVRYNARRNPNPSKTSHNTLIEVIWTGVPIIILVVIFFPSMKLLYLQDEIPEADIVIQATGHQWYWSYQYPDHGGIEFDSIMLPVEYWDEDRGPEVEAQRQAAVADISAMLGGREIAEIERLLDTDTRVVVPINKVVKVLVTASDVIHSWTIPAFGFKIDAVPGRFNETWFKATELGTFYGQCSELCGIRHAFMPIVVEVVTEEEFAAWVARAQEAYADAAPARRVQLADAGAATSNK
ncbi:MAG: cytochrome c oxidase subunit II [Sphingomonadales bacterium]|nr:cytochrome c oxidase subunit II [Sphingomonadales bacterium]